MAERGAAEDDRAFAKRAVDEVGAEREGRRGGADVVGDGAIAEGSVVIIPLGADGDGVGFIQAEVHGAADGFASVVLRAVLNLIAAQVGVGGAGGRADGGGGVRSPVGIGAMLRIINIGFEQRQGVAEIFRNRVNVDEVKAGFDFAGGFVGGAAGFLEVFFVAVGAYEGAVAEGGFSLVEGAAGHEIDRTAESVGCGLGRAGLKNFDAAGIVDRNLLKLERAASGGRVGAGDTVAVQRDRGVIGRNAAHGNRTRIGRDVVDRDAGEEFHEVAEITLGDVTEGVGGDDVFDRGRETLFVNRDGSGVHFDGGGDLESVELEHVTVFIRGGGFGGEIDIEIHRGTRRDGDGDRLIRETGIESVHFGGASGNVAQAEKTGRIRERFKRGAIDGNADVVEIFTVVGVKDAAFDDAGGGSLSGRLASKDE